MAPMSPTADSTDLVASGSRASARMAGGTVADPKAEPSHSRGRMPPAVPA